MVFIARWASHLDVTEIETLTLAFAFLNVLTCALWWNKPKNVDFPIEIDLRSSPAPKMSDVPVTDNNSDFSLNRTSSTFENDTEQESMDISIREETVTSPHSPLSLQSLGRDSSTSSPAKYSRWTTIVRISISWFRLFQLYTFYPFYVMCESKTDYENISSGRFLYTSEKGFSEASPKFFIPVCIVAFIFGGIHLIPVWLSHFPTSLERYGWLGCAVWVAALPILCLGEKVISTFSWGPKWIVDGHRVGFPIFVQYGFSVYGGTRHCVMILALLALRRLPCKAYEDIQWSTFVPHI
jgi:hypothetical protein